MTASASEVETHKLDPRVYAPLRVCPQCSLAWESESEWCPSCGTAFDSRDRTTRVARAARPRSRGGSVGRTRNTGERAVAHPPEARRRAAGSRRGMSGWLVVAALLAVLVVGAGAFVAGQATRDSKAEVNAKIDQAVRENTQSAIASAQRELARQRANLQAEFKQRLTAAEQKAYADGQARAKAQAQNSAGSFADSIKRCIQNFLVDC